MLNILWTAMILGGIVFAALQGNLADVTNAALDSSKEAVTLCVTMIGVMSFWMGVMEIAKKAGLITRATEAIRPLIRFLFPRIPENHPATEAISTNFIANVLGLGWAATPAGLKAMHALADLEESRRRRGTSMPVGAASNEMCTFLILNISSLQLIPVNVIAYRSQYGSVNPASIVGPAILATAVSTAVAMLFCKLMNHFTSLHAL